MHKIHQDYKIALIFIQITLLLSKKLFLRVFKANPIINAYINIDKISAYNDIIHSKHIKTMSIRFNKITYRVECIDK